MIKVAVWGTGAMGLIALRGVIDHPELELVSVVVHGESKAGQDAGRLCGISPVGVVTTQDPAEALEGDAEVVVYAAAGNLRPFDAIVDMASALAHGKDVVSCSVVPLVFPEAVDRGLVEPLARACAEGGTSFFNSGIDPGFANDVLPLALSGLSRNIESIRVTEMFNYGTYPDREAVYEILGFGKPPDFEAIAAAPGAFTFAWGPVLHQLASGLGLKIDHLEESIERVVADEGFDTPTGRIDAGTVGAMRSTLVGHVDGAPKLVVDHVTRMHDDLASDWPRPHISTTPPDLGYPGASGRGAYRVEIDGSPAIRCELELTEHSDHDFGARVAGAARLVNAIPAVVRARPGLLSALDLPLITGRGVVKAAPGPSPDSRLVDAFLQ
jgi:4-hydroxy-tetrahydrodipicolinate reductase